MKEYKVEKCPFFLGVFQSKLGEMTTPWGVIVQAKDVTVAAAFIKENDSQECFKFYEADNFAELADNFEKLVGTKHGGAVAWRSAQTTRWVVIEN